MHLAGASPRTAHPGQIRAARTRLRSWPRARAAQRTRLQQGGIVQHLFSQPV